MTTKKAESGSDKLYGCSVGRTIRWMAEKQVSLPAIQSVLKENKIEMSEADIAAHVAALKDGSKKAGVVSKKDAAEVAAIITKHGHKLPASLVAQESDNDNKAKEKSTKKAAPRKNANSRRTAKLATKPALSKTESAASTTA